MFHVKHNNKDNILHVHIGDCTHTHTPRQSTGSPPAGHRQATGRRAAHLAGKRAIGRLFVLYIEGILITMDLRLCLVARSCVFTCFYWYSHLFAFYWLAKKNFENPLTVYSVLAILKTVPNREKVLLQSHKEVKK